MPLKKKRGDILPRPNKRRYICKMPKYGTYGPIGRRAQHESCVRMTVDEYEAIRLIDYEGNNQEECAIQMDVARTTAQRIYMNARNKIAVSFVEGRCIKIEGGHYQLCEEGRRKNFQGQFRCQQCRRPWKEEKLE
jgi:predicted DNA-binding protein (UPF0251 family)